MEAKTRVNIELKNGKNSYFLSPSKPTELRGVISNASKFFNDKNSELRLIIFDGIKDSCVLVNMNEIVVITFTPIEADNAAPR